MKLPSLNLWSILLLMAAGCGQEITRESADLVLKGATVFDGNGQSIENAVIIISGDTIVKIGGKDLIIPEGAEIMDVRRKYIMPGLVDAHVHFFQTGFFDSRPDVIDLRDSFPHEELIEYQKKHPQRYYNAYYRSGVTAVYDVAGFPWSINLQKTAENRPEAPHVAASGILITAADPHLLDFFNSKSDTIMGYLSSPEKGRYWVKKNSQLGSTGIKIWTLNPTDSSFIHNMRAVADEIDRQGNYMIAHATTLEEAKLAVKLGARLLVHSVMDRRVDHEFTEMLLTKKVIYTPNLITLGGYLNAARALMGIEQFIIKDPHSLVDSQTTAMLKNANQYQSLVNREQTLDQIKNLQEAFRIRESIMIENLQILYQAGVTMVVGTDAGNPGTLHGISIYDELEALQAAGIEAEDLIMMATKNGAMAMDRIADFGTLEPGKLANLIIMDQNPAEDIAHIRGLTHVMKKGNLIEVK